MKKMGLSFIFLWFILGGLAHFLMTPFFIVIMPPSIPYPYAAVYVSGVFELLGAIGILIPRLRPYAGLGLVLLTLAVTPANVYMWQHPALFPEFPPVLLSLRLVFQVVLVAGIVWCTSVPSLFAKHRAFSQF